MRYTLRQGPALACIMLGLLFPQYAASQDGTPRIIKASMERLICVELADKRDHHEEQADKIYLRLLADLDMSGDDNAIIAQMTLPVIMALKGRQQVHIDAYHTLANQYEGLKHTTRQRRCRLVYRHKLNAFLDYVSSRIA